MEFAMSTCYFGVKIDSTLSLSCHIDDLCKSYSKKLGALKRCLAFHQEQLRRFILKQFYQESYTASLYRVVVQHHSAINHKKSMPKQPYIFKQYLVRLITSGKQALTFIHLQKSHSWNTFTKCLTRRLQHGSKTCLHWERQSRSPDEPGNLRWKDPTKKLQDSPSNIEKQCRGTLCQTELKILRSSIHLKAI